MRKLILLSVILLFAVNSFAQWQWAQSGTSAFSWDEGYGIATDSAGNAYVVGMFSSHSIDFGTFTLPNANAGTDDVFIVKYSPSGIPLWAQRAGGADYDYGMAVTTDAFGNVYVTGHYYSPSIIFGIDTLINTAGGGTDIYTVKYSSAGNEIWARTGGGIGFDESTTICTDALGNIYVAGQFYSASMVFGADTIFNTGDDTLDMFIVKYDASGNEVWARSAGGTGNDAISSIASDRGGNVIVTGSSGSPVCNFGAVTLTNPGILGYNDVFTVKYDSTGNSLWGRRGEGSSFESGSGVSADTAGNVFVTGDFSSVFIVFGNDTLYNARTIGGPTDIFIVKYSPSGNELWAKRAGKQFIDNSSGIGTDISGNAYITGNFQDTITFGSTILTNMGVDDIFVAKYDPAGNAVSANSAGGAGSDHSFALSINTGGDAFITGDFYSNTLTVGSSALPISGGGYSDVFIAKLSLTTGINEFAINNAEWIIYPNPATEVFQVANSKYKVESIKVFNVAGAMVTDKWFMADVGCSVDMSGVAKGIYFVQITDEKKNVVNKKIVIQ